MALVIHLHHAQFLPEDRLAQAMADLVAINLAAATIARFSRDGAGRFQGFADAVERLGEDGGGQAQGRNRLSGRRQNPVAPHRQHSQAGLPPGPGDARQLGRTA